MATKRKRDAKGRLLPNNPEPAEEHEPQMDAQYDPRLPRAYTEEGMAERAEELRARGVPLRKPGDPRVSVVTDQHDKVFQQRQDAADDRIPEWQAPEPVEELVARHGKPGMRYRLLSEKVCDKRGMRRWDPVKDQNGENVTFGKMFLGEMPEDLAQARERFYGDKARDEVLRSQDAQQEQLNRVGHGEAHGLEHGVVVRDVYGRGEHATGLTITQGPEPE